MHSTFFFYRSFSIATIFSFAFGSLQQTNELGIEPNLQIQKSNLFSEFHEACFNLDSDRIIGIIELYNNHQCEIEGFSHTEAIEYVLEGSSSSTNPFDDENLKSAILDLLIQDAFQKEIILDLRKMKSGSTEDILLLTRKFYNIYHNDPKSIRFIASSEGTPQLLVPTVHNMEAFWMKYFNQIPDDENPSFRKSLELVTSFDQIERFCPTLLLPEYSSFYFKSLLGSGLPANFEKMLLPGEWVKEFLLYVLKSSNPTAIQIIQPYMAQEAIERSLILETLGEMKEGVVDVFHTASLEMIKYIISLLPLTFDVTTADGKSFVFKLFAQVKLDLPKIAKKNRDPDVLWYLFNLTFDEDKKAFIQSENDGTAMAYAKEFYAQVLQNYLNHVTSAKRPPTELFDRLRHVKSFKWFSDQKSNDCLQACRLIFSRQIDSNPVFVAFRKRRYGIAYELMKFLSSYSDDVSRLNNPVVSGRRSLKFANFLSYMIYAQTGMLIYG